MNEEHEYIQTHWSSDGKMPYEKCVADIHVYYHDGYSAYEGILCECKRTYWDYITCEHCKHTHGEAFDIDTKKPVK